MNRPWLFFVLALLALVVGFVLGRTQAADEVPEEGAVAVVEVIDDLAVGL